MLCYRIPALKGAGGPNQNTSRIKHEEAQPTFSLRCFFYIYVPGAEHCEWAEERGTCQVKGTTLPCDYHSEKELCNKADHCEYDVLAEYVWPATPVLERVTPCSRIYGGDVSVWPATPCP